MQRARARHPSSRPAVSPRPTPQASPWLVGLAVAAVAVTISIIAFGLFGATDGEATATTIPVTTVPGTDDGDGDDNGDDPGNGTQATIPGDATAPPIVAVGDPIPIAELTMSAGGIGPLEFGADGSQVLGRLTATFGPHTNDTGFNVGSGAFGECVGDSVRIVQWGPLAIVVQGDVDGSTFVGYRIDLRYGGALSEVSDLATLSGLRVGDTVLRLREIYEANFDIVFRVHQALGTTFELRTSAQGDILLWGPVESDADESTVTGIYSPDACRAGPGD